MSKSFSLENPVSYLAQRDVSFALLMFFNVFFNLTDLGTTYVALSSGLSEGNSLVYVVSAALGLNPLAALVAMKVPVVLLVIIAGLFGVRSKDFGRRNTVALFLLTSTLIFFVISVNNIGWIIS